MVNAAPLTTAEKLFMEKDIRQWSWTTAQLGESPEELIIFKRCILKVPWKYVGQLRQDSLYGFWLAIRLLDIFPNRAQLQERLIV